jgi:NTE family protein
MTSTPDPTIGPALGRLFAKAVESGEAIRFSLPCGAPLFLADEPANELFLLARGRMAALRPKAAGQGRFLGLIRPGEPAGEMSLIAGGAHSADVVALRDCELVSLPRDSFLRAVETEPGLALDMARLILNRSRPSKTTRANEASVFGFLALHEAQRVGPLVDAVGCALRDAGYRVAVVGGEGLKQTETWFTALEEGSDVVLLAAEADEAAWKHVMCGQVDRLFRVASGAHSPSMDIDLASGTALDLHRLTDLILVQAQDCRMPAGSAEWVAAVHPDRLFQIRTGSEADAERLGRIITGRSVGLVLSGGAARAYAHLGVIRELRARGAPIDFIAGVSMGAIIGACVAMDWSNEEIDQRIREAFVRSNPINDLALPLVALMSGRKMRSRLEDHFGEQDIADLWLPFFCVSSNLTTGRPYMHTRGRLRDALTASAALPGILPPSTAGDEVLVDGAVVNNFPVDIMRTLHPGPIVGADVSRGRSITAEDLASGPWRQWLLGRGSAPIVALLMRAATMSTTHEIIAAREASDVLILPRIDGIDVANWKAYEQAVALGEAAAREALDALTGPVSELRRYPKGV